MKPVYGLYLLVIAAVLVACAGCASTAPPAPAPVTTTIPVMTTAAPAPEPTPYPGALALNQEAPFGIAGKNGTATVYKAEVRSNYSWSSPSFNSPHEQGQAGAPLGTQHGYNTEEPAAGNAFLFVYVRLADTGSERIVAPSPGQFTVNSGGKTYSYRSVRGSDVTVSGVRVTQYDYLIGNGGVLGFIQPGASNIADGYLIYEVPATIDLQKAYLVVTLDAQHQSAWKLG